MLHTWRVAQFVPQSLFYTPDRADTCHTKKGGFPIFALSTYET